MSSIIIPARYRFPDLIAKIGTITYKQQCRVNFWISLGCLGLGVKQGKAFWRRRVRNSFLQIYSVQFLNPDTEERDLVRGKIMADECDIFDLQMDKDIRHDIDVHGFARLIGPMDPLETGRDVMFYPKLFRKNRSYDFFHPQSGIKFGKSGEPTIKGVAIPPLDEPGYYGMSLCDHRSHLMRCDKLFSDQFETTCGPVKVTYAYFNDSADSFLTVKLVKWNREGGDKPANVYGKICTSDTLLCGDDRAKSVVFDLKRDECVSVKPDEYIRLHKPMTIVPMGHELKVEVKLFHNTMGSGDDDKEGVVIANGTCFFTAKSGDRDLPVDLDQCEDGDDITENDDENQSDSKDYDDENQCDCENSSAYDDENQSALGEDQFTHYDEKQAAYEDQSKQEMDEDEHLLEISDLKTISGGWGEIEIKVYWQPGWYSYYRDYC